VGQEFGSRHVAHTKVDLEAWRQHQSRPLGASGFSSSNNETFLLITWVRLITEVTQCHLEWHYLIDRIYSSNSVVIWIMWPYFVSLLCMWCAFSRFGPSRDCPWAFSGSWNGPTISRLHDCTLYAFWRAQYCCSCARCAEADEHIVMYLPLRLRTPLLLDKTIHSWLT